MAVCPSGTQDVDRSIWIAYEAINEGAANLTNAFAYYP
jgi:hypothetical protein